jgi:hypothetical protein
VVRAIRDIKERAHGSSLSPFLFTLRPSAFILALKDARDERDIRQVCAARERIV